MKRLNIKIYGRVQGVFFRYSAQELAQKLNINGFASNERDGTVYIEAEGEEENLNDFLEWCKQGSTSAKIDKVESEFSQELKNYQDFKIY